MEENDLHEVVEKQYYTITEVAEIVSESPTVLRFWEKEFEVLRPRKGSHGNRMYINRDIEIIKMIHYLVRQKRYTLSGARERLTNNSDLSKIIFLREKLVKIREELLLIRNKL